MVNVIWIGIENWNVDFCGKEVIIEIVDLFFVDG